MKSLSAGIFLMVFSTLCFYVPSTIYSLEGFDSSQVPTMFYNYYLWMMAGAFALNIVYASFLFYFIDSRNLFLKIPVCWLILGESYTLVYHVINKGFLMNLSSEGGKIVTLVIFTICLTFFLYRAVVKPKSDSFNPAKTYILNYYPKDLLGIFSWIVNHSGRKVIYQDGDVYGFRKKTGKVEKSKIHSRTIKENVAFTEIPIIREPERIIGRKFQLFKYNCNTMVRDATGT